MPAAVNLVRALQAIVRQLPERVTVTYYPRSTGITSADNFGTGVEFDAMHGPLVDTDAGGKSRRFTTWHLYATDGQTARPARMGKLVDNDGVTWHIMSVTTLYGELKHDLDCVEAVA